MNIRFNDIGNQHWAADFIRYLANARAGIVQGFPDGTFRPEDTVSIGEFCTMAVRAAEIPTANINNPPHWATRYVNIATGRGIRLHAGVGAPNLDAPIERQFAFNITWRIIPFNEERSDEAGMARDGRMARWNAFHDRNQIINDNNVLMGIRELFLNGGIEGRTGNTLAPRETLTRAEAAVIIARCLATDDQIEQFAVMQNQTHHQKIIIDAGHFGYFWNIQNHTYNNETFRYVESIRMWDLQELIVQELQDMGFVNAVRLRDNIHHTFTTQQQGESQRDWKLRENLQRGLRAGDSELFIQLHTDAAGNSEIDWAVVLYPMGAINETGRVIPNTTPAQLGLGGRIAEAIRTTMKLNGVSRVESTTWINPNTGVLEDAFPVMRGARTAGCPRYFITENSFHTNPRAAWWLMQDANLQRLARAYAEVIRDVFIQ